MRDELEVDMSKYRGEDGRVKLSNAIRNKSNNISFDASDEQISELVEVMMNEKNNYFTVIFQQPLQIETRR